MKTKTAMAPSSDQRRWWTLQSTTASSSVDGESSEMISRVSPQPHPDEPNIYLIPGELPPVFRSPPTLVRMAIGLLATYVATITSWNVRIVHENWVWAPLLLLRRGWQWKKVFLVAFKACLFYTSSLFAIQELPSFRPSRISTTNLVANYFLPSPLSKLETIQNQRIHFVEYRSKPGMSSVPVAKESSTQRRVVYLNHGFGASSLSWLPVVPKLAEMLNATVVLGHDAPGFGFTRRLSGSTAFYTLDNSAEIATQLVQIRESNITDAILLGHSMGALTTLRMALKLPPHIQTRIVLVEPALDLQPTRNVTKKRHGLSSFIRSALKIPIRPLQGVATAIGVYGLRRLVGQPNFWRHGLSAAWGDSKKLKDSDVLRFQWPSIGLGWEQGLLNFGTSRWKDEPSYMSDQYLLQAVLDSPNVELVHVIVSSNDKIVPPCRTRKFLKQFPSVEITEMKGPGHDPFEEAPDEFMEKILRILS
jgi:pimeloyl-ACP methyl ester carboxylesterase